MRAACSFAAIVKRGGELYARAVGERDKFVDDLDEEAVKG